MHRGGEQGRCARRTGSSEEAGETPEEVENPALPHLGCDGRRRAGPSGSHVGRGREPRRSRTGMMRLGLFGGTFDPMHQGHLDVAEAARRALQLSCVWVVPARVPPHRRAPAASAAHRFAMAAIACANAPGLLLSDLEMEDATPSYTEGTLDRLPSLGVNVGTLFLVTGADAFRDIQTWKGFPGILDRCHFVVVSRPGHSAP